jgi:cytoskeletal protein RodZ
MGDLHTKLGELLGIERKRRNLDLKDIAEELNITVGNLEALENGDVDALPTELYFKLFAKTYCEHLGIDYSRTIEAINDEIPESAGNGRTQLENGGSTPDYHQKSAPRWKEAKLSWVLQWSSGRRLVAVEAGAVVLLLVVIGVSNLFWNDTETSGGETTTSDIPTESISSVEAQASTSTDHPDFDWNVAEAAEPDRLTLKITAREESWATVLADGDTVIYRNLAPWREYNVEAKYRILVSIGIPSVVETILNGKRVNLVDSDTKRVSRLEINQTNIVSLLSGTDIPEVSVESRSQQPAAVAESPAVETDDQTISEENTIDSI